MIAADAVIARGKFSIVTTGGQSVIDLYRYLRLVDADWQAWRVYWTDERCLPIDHTERNSRQTEDLWLRHVPIPKNQVFPIPAELGPAEAAESYSRILGREGQFDLVLLSLGEDGHVASIFPGMEAYDQTNSVVAVFNAPKYPAQRVSMSLRTLAGSRHSVLLSVGNRKCVALSAHISGKKQPSTMLAQMCGLEIWTDLRLASATELAG